MTARLQGATSSPATAPVKPEHVPDKFWDGVKGEVRVDALARSYGELAHRFAKGKETLVPQIKAEIEAERMKGRPPSPDAYALRVPDKGPLAEAVQRLNLVLLDRHPGADFRPDAGKRYFVVEPKHPMLAFWRETAHKAGLSQDAFMQGVVAYVENELARQPSEEKMATLRQAEWAKLGPHGEARAGHAWRKLTALVGEERASALEGFVQDARAIEAVETLLERVGEPRFSAGAGGTGAGLDDLKAEADRLIGASDYYTNPAKQARVAAIFKKLYPGQIRTAPLNRGE